MIGSVPRLGLAWCVVALGWLFGLVPVTVRHLGLSAAAIIVIGLVVGYYRLCSSMDRPEADR